MSLTESQQRNLLRFGHRARIWALLHLNPNIFFTVDEIATETGLKASSVRQGLKFVKILPLIQTRIYYENDIRVIRYGFVPI